jgi:hypothetical protein
MRETARVLVLLMFSIAMVSCEPSESNRARDGRNPLEEKLRGMPGAPRQEGIAAAILLDTSGSMRDEVPDINGSTKRKLELAQRALLSLVRQFDEFSRKNPDRKVLVGIYEFSSREDQPHCREVVRLGPPNLDTANAAVESLRASGGTPIGDAMILAKHDLDGTGLSRRHILVVTDGENNRGYAPGDVADVIARLPEADRVSIYFVAFDVAAERFNSVRDAGGLVLSANNETDLKQTLDFVLTGKILVEQPIAPATK